MIEMQWRYGPDLSAVELHDLLRLRTDVFVVEQECAYPELDGRDLLATTLHGWVETETETEAETETGSGPRIVAAIRLLGDENPPRIGRVVTHADHRGQGLAAQMVETAHRRAGESGSFLEAQSYLVDWYEALGWQVTGAEFIEDGIPHTPMRRPGVRPG